MARNINHGGHRGRTAFATVGSFFLVGFLCVLCDENAPAIQTPDLALPQEKHLRNVRQLTFGGENAEAYFSSDGKKLTFQSTRDGRECDQIYTMNIDGSDVKLVSTGDGRTTCSYFFPTANAFSIRPRISARNSVRPNLTFQRAMSGPSMTRSIFSPPGLTAQT